MQEESLDEIGEQFYENSEDDKVDHKYLGTITVFTVFTDSLILILSL